MDVVGYIPIHRRNKLRKFKSTLSDSNEIGQCIVYELKAKEALQKSNNFLYPDICKNKSQKSKVSVERLKAENSQV
jgi:hypothetical protein